MHQQTRHPSRGGYSPASSPQTNPTRTNNPRDAPTSRSRATSEAAPPGPSLGAASAGDGGTSAAPAAAPVSGPTRESIKKLDQIIQNYYLKAAVLIVQSRIPVTPSGGSRGRKTNKWFQIETDDIDDFKDELKLWKQCGSFENRPPPMVIETYLDASRLAAGQALVVMDENDKPRDALEALNASDLSASGSGSSTSGRSDNNNNNNNNNNKTRTRTTEIVLERWRVELRCIPSLLRSASGVSGSSSGSSGDGSSANRGSRGRDGGGDGGDGGGGGSDADFEIEDFGPILPTIYKRSIVFFRSLFAFTLILPAYRFSRQATTKAMHPALKVRCRVLTGAEAEARISAHGFDSLRQPLFFDNGRDAVTDYMFGDLEVPIGRFSASVSYRNDCSFRVVDSESLFSSRFMGIDENDFRPSLPPSQRPDNIYLGQQRNAHQQAARPHQHRRRDSSTDVVGSLPSHHRHGGRNAGEHPYRAQPQQTYGSLSTFHGADALGTSPISALKAVRPIGSESSSPTDSVRPSSMDQRPQIDPPNSLPITAGRHGIAAAGMSPSSSISTRQPVLRNLDGLGRRPSVSFQPFKAGSLSGSPRTTQEELPLPSSPLSGSRPGSGLSALAQARNRSSLTAGMAASLRGAPLTSTSVGSTSAALAAATAAVMDPGQSSSPRMAGASRYSSSFTHRRGRSSFGGASRNEDDQGSSGKQSLASSMAQPGSGLLAEAGGGGSSGSFQTDDDNISEFLKALESKKTLQSFEVSSKRADSARRTVAQLSRFQLMRESNVALTDSMNSSMQMMPRSSLSSSTRQQHGGALGMPYVSGHASGNVSLSLSPSSHSPIKPLSPNTPHTPHTPAVPSRLSENAIIDYQGQASVRPGGQAEEGDEGKAETGREGGMGGTTAIDIPLSPRLLQTGGHRPSSAAQKPRAQNVDDDSAELAAFGTQRSVSTGGDDREPPSPGTLFRLEREGPNNGSSQASAGGLGAGAASSPAVAIGGGVAGLRAAAAGILRPSSGGALQRPSAHGRDDVDVKAGASSMPPAPAAVAAALRSSTATGASQRRRYMSRHQSGQSAQSSDTPGTRGGSGSDGRPTPPQLSRGSISSSFMGRYSGSGRGSGSGSAASGLGGHTGAGGAHEAEADDEPLVFDLSELGRDPSRRSIDESRGAGHGSGSASGSRAANRGTSYDSYR